jgi:hypothetical protein
VTALASLVEAAAVLQRTYQYAIDSNDRELARLVRDAQRTLNLAFRSVVANRAEETCS